MINDKLCTCCQPIFTTNDYVYHDHHTNAQDLLVCSCPLCIILCDSLRQVPVLPDFSNPDKPATQNDGHFLELLAVHSPLPPLTYLQIPLIFYPYQGSESPEHDANGTEFKYFITNDYVTGERAVTIFFFVDFPNRPMRKIDLFVPILIIPAGGCDAGLSTTPSTNTSTDETWKTATDWIEHCNTAHPNCRRATEPPKRLPTRLLDVGTVTDPCLRLRESTGVSSTERYATLSHCWGGNTIEMLEEGKLASMLTAIVPETLPKTFQDAILITRRLKIRYLWIDSLCIIQNSSDDWAREASMMGSVYQNGSINIAATGAKNGSIGCFRERNPTLAQPCRVKMDAALSKFGLKPGLYDLVPRKLWEEGVLSAPLNRRAWVVQERVLATRVLHFGRNQLFWECNELDACETYPKALPPSITHSARKTLVTGGEEFGFLPTSFKNLDPASVRSQIKIKKAPWTYSLIDHLPFNDQIDPYYVWNRIVIAYTRCALTEPKDKLVAISAVAKKVQEMTKGDEYLAGLWKKFLPFHLLWRTDQQDPTCKRMRNYRAPSWSWASMKGRIEPYIYIRPDSTIMIRVLEGHVDALTEDLMGQVTGGYIRLRGWLRKFPTGRETQLNMIGIELPQVADGAQFDEADEQMDGDQEVWFLPILGLGRLWTVYEALGLMLVETGNDGEFRRVGRFSVRNDVAKKFFRRPAYRQTGSDDGRGSGLAVSRVSEFSILDKVLAAGMWRKSDDKDRWIERVITII